jgi:4-hydroxybenzoate polyprenyltransferase
MPLVLALPAVGFGFGHWEHALSLRVPGALVVLLAAWWLLSAGALWLNAALDRDEGDVLMGQARPVPADISRWAYVALASGVVLAATTGVVPGSCALACAVLAVAYSHPGFALKGHAVFGPVINVVGYGVLSPLAGWALVGGAPTPRTPVAFALLACWVAGTYVGAQAFQEDEDRRRGYHTFVATHGARAAVVAARLLFGAAFWGGVVAAAVGWFPRLLVAAVPSWWALDRHLALWARHPEWGAAGGRTMLRAGVALAVAVFAAVLAQHVWCVATGAPPAGLGTVWRPTS